MPEKHPQQGQDMSQDQSDSVNVAETTIAPQDPQPAAPARRRWLLQSGKLAVGALPVMATLHSRSALAGRYQIWSESASTSMNPSVELIMPDASLYRGAITFRNPEHFRLWPAGISHGAEQRQAGEGGERSRLGSGYRAQVVITRELEQAMRRSRKPLRRLLEQGATRVKDIPLAGYRPFDTPDNELADFPVLQVLWTEQASTGLQRRQARAAIAGAFNCQGPEAGFYAADKPGYPVSPRLLASLITDMYAGRVPLQPERWLGATTVVEFLEQLVES